MRLPIAILVVSLTGIEAPASALIRLFVEEKHSTTEVFPANCAITGNAGESADRPGLDDSAFESALSCADNTTNALAGDDVEIVILCREKAGCDYQLDDTLRLTYPATASLAHQRIITGQSIGQGVPQPRLFVDPSISSRDTISIKGQNWTIRGFDIDGQDRHRGVDIGTEDSAHPTSNIILERNNIHNMTSSCVSIPDKEDHAGDGGLVLSRTTSVQIRNNTIQFCRKGNATTPDAGFLLETSGTGTDREFKETHCIHSHSADFVTVAGNLISGCSGDGVQVERYVDGKPSAEDPFTDQPGGFGIQVVENIITAPPCETVGWSDGSALHFMSRTLGEGGIDIKRHGTGLVVADNTLFGFRKSFKAVEHADDANSFVCAGTGTGDRGVAILIHGQTDNASSTTNVNRCATLCTGTDALFRCASTAVDCSESEVLCEVRDETRACGLVEGNDISDAGGGITIGFGKTLDEPFQGNLACPRSSDHRMSQIIS